MKKSNCAEFWRAWHGIHCIHSLCHVDCGPFINYEKHLIFQLTYKGGMTVNWVGRLQSDTVMVISRWLGFSVSFYLQLLRSWFGYFPQWVCFLKVLWHVTMHWVADSRNYRLTIQGLEVRIQGVIKVSPLWIPCGSPTAFSQFPVVAGSFWHL